MAKRLTNTEIVNLILEEDLNIIQEDEEIIHLLLDKTVSKNVNESHKETLSFSSKISDKIAETVGSWTFIISFCIILLLWITINAIFLIKPFDQYPFILLNLLLSCVAALQAPVIMMSQNRQEHKDRIRAENDYKVNLKSELIIEDLHGKLDKIISNHEDIIMRLNSIDNTK
jgi:uncharacterized membrane protein